MKRKSDDDYDEKREKRKEKKEKRKSVPEIRAGKR